MLSQSWLSSEMRQKNSKTWFEKTTKHCDAQRRARPRLYFETKTFKVNQNILSNTTWGQRLKAVRTLNNMERRAFNGEFLRFALREKQAHWLLLAMMNGDSNEFDYPLWLSSSNASYNNVIEGTALNLLLCEWDNTGLCGPSSMIMLLSCSNTPGDCGLPYPEWFEKNHMPGVKKDVALVLANLNAFANGEDIE